MLTSKVWLTLRLMILFSLVAQAVADPAKVVGTARDGSGGALYLKSFDGQWSRIEGAAEVPTGSRLMTDSGNAAVMEFPGGVKAVLGPQASLNYLGNEGGVCSLRLIRGTTHFVVPANANMKLEAGTLLCQVSNGEGEAALELLGNPSFSCVRGELSVTGSSGEMYRVGPNTRLSVATDGKTVEIRPSDQTITSVPASAPQNTPPIPSQPPVVTDAPQPQNQPPAAGNPDVWSSFPGVLERILPVILNRNGGGLNIPNLPINIPGLPR
jgi:hypothetical protein